MALDGIRLSDLYASKDYNNWMNDSTNSRLVESAIQQSPDSDPNKVRGHLYLNSKIKSAIGEEAFAKLPHMNLEQKLNWFNTNVGQPSAPEELEEPEIEQPATEQRDTLAQQLQQPGDSLTQNSPEYDLPTQNFWTGATIGEKTLREWFRDNAGGDYSAYVESRKAKREEARRANEEFPNIDLTGVWGSGYKSGETKKLEDELSVLRETNPNDTFSIKLKENQLKLSRERDFNQTKDALSSLYKEAELSDTITGDRSGYFAPIDRKQWGTENTQRTVDELTTNLRERLDADGTFAFDTFKSFEDEMIKNVPQYRNYHDSYALPFSPDEMKDIMAEYYALRQLKDPNEALSFASAVFQQRLADKQSLHDKAAIAWKQDGANIAGNTVATVGLVLNSINGLIGASDKDYDIDDLGWWKEFLYYSADNPVTRWGNRMVTTGVWQPELQEAFEETQYNALQLQRAPGEETDFFNVNTPFELFAQSGFTVAGMATGTATAQVLANTVGRGSAALATKMLAKEAGTLSRVVGKSINVLGKELVTVGTAYLPAAAEASMDAVETYNVSKEQAAEAVLTGMKDQLAREYEDGTYETWYQRNSRIPYDLNVENGLTEEQQAELAQLRNQERAYLWDTYQTLRQQEVLSDPEVAQMIEMGARRAAAKNMFDETTWIALGDYAISNTLGKAFKETKKAARRALLGENINNKFKWVPEGNHYRPVVKEITFRDKLGAIARGVAEAGEEGFEELFQTVDTKMRQDLNKHMISQYIENRYDPEGAATVTDRMFQNWAVTKASLNENLLSDEALYSFALGAVSAGLGSPTGFRGVQTFRNTLAKTDSFKEAIKQGIVASWRNPIVENWNDLKIKQIEDQQEANDLNRWISAHPEIDTLNDEAAIIGFIDQQAQAARDGDEATYRDAVMGQNIATMLMFERVNPNGSKANFYERIKQLSKLTAADPQARNVIDQVLSSRGDNDVVRTTEGPLNEEETAILEGVKDKASKMLETYKNLKAEIGVLDSQFGDAISREAKEALAYSLIMQKDWDNRINSITSKAIEAYNAANPDTPVTPISEEERASLNALAKYGNKKTLDAEYEALMKQKAALKARRKNMYSYEYKAAADKNQQAIKENRAAAKALAKLEDGRVVTAEEILSLGSKERAYLLDESNQERFSEAQKAEVREFLSSEGIRGDMVTDLIDAGRLQNKKDYFKAEYDSLMRHNGATIPIFDREVRKKASKTWTRAKLANAMEATSYDEFRDAMDQALQTGEFTDNDRMVMSEIFNEPETPDQTNNFYQQYKKEEMTRRNLRSIIEDSPEFQKLDDNQKQVVESAVEQVQREGREVTTDSIIAKLNDKEYLGQLERQGVDVSALTNAKTLEELANAVAKAMEQKRVYDENAKALRENLGGSKAAKEENPGGTPKPEGKESNTIIPKDKYEGNKEKLTGIFKKVANNFVRRRKQPLTQDEYRDFINLYAGESVTGNVLVDDLNTAVTPEAFAENIDKLETAIKNKLYTDENAKDSEEVQNSIKLSATLQGILNNISDLQKSGVDTSLQTLVKNSILELAPELAAEFNVQQVRLPRKFGRLDGKAEKNLTTNTEKKWYADHKIADNLKTLMGLNMATADYVFIKDSELERQLKEELGEELTDDNLPLILAARVPLKTPGAIQGKDGYNYLYVSLVANSRAVPVAEERNEYNSLRYLAMEQEEDGPVTNNGATVVAQGAVPKMPVSTTNKNETTSLRDWLFDKYKDVKNENERKDKIVQDFTSHYRRIKLVTKDGETKGAFEWNGKEVKVSWDTTAPDGERTPGAYIQENGDGTVTPLFIEVKRIDEVDFDDTHTMYEMLNDPSIDITSKTYANNEGNYIRKSIVALTNLIVSYKDSLTSGRSRAKILPMLNGDSTKPGAIQKSIGKYLNLSKTASEQKGKISIGVQTDGDKLQLICWETGTEDDKEPIYGIPMVLSSIPLSVLDGTNPGKVSEAVALFVKESMKNLLYNEEGKLRTADTRGDGKQWPVIKFEDNERKNDKDVTKVFDESDVRLKLLGNIWQVRKYAIKQAPETVSVNGPKAGPTGPVSPSSPNAQAEAIKRITAPEFIDEHEGEHFEIGPNETEVTTFIKGGEDDIDWGEKSLAGQFATNLGTSVDKLYRVWRRERTPESITAYMKERGVGAWPGLSRTDGLPKMLEQFKRIDKFFEDRGEVQVDADLIFRANVEYAGKHKYLVGKPDIITVDKNGIYHIYDMKSFRYQSGSVAQVPGFNSMFFTINGKRNIETDMDKWRKQMSMYKAMIESKLGAGTVSDDLGVIPIRLGYSADGTIDPYVVQGVGAHKLQDRLGKPLHLNFASAPMEKSPSGAQEPITRCYDEPIKLQAITKLDDINPEGWKQMGTAENLRRDLNLAKEGVAPATPENAAPVNPTPAPAPANPVGSPELRGPVTMYTPGNEAGTDELLDELAGLGGEIDDSMIDQLQNNGACNVASK